MAGSADIPSMIAAAADKYGVDPQFATSIAHTESGLNQSAVSPAGAVGVMQLMPSTAKGLGVDPTDLAQNIDGGVHYLSQLGHQFNGDPQMVAAAYNAGPGAVQKYGGVPPYKETQDYVQKVTGSPANAAPSDGMPSLASLYKSMGLDSTGHPINTAQAPAAPSPQEEQPPPLSVLYKQMGLRPDGTSGSETPQASPNAPQGLTPAQQQVAATAANRSQAPGALAAGVNSFTFGLLPNIDAGVEALKAGGRNALAGMGVGQAGPSMADTYQGVHAQDQSQLDAFAQAHPVQNLLATAGGMAVGGPASLLEHGVEGLAARGVEAVAPNVAGSLGARIATRAAGAGAVGAGYGTVEGLQHGEGVPQALTEGAETGAITAPLGAAGEILPAAFAGLKNPILRKAIPAAAGAGIGAAAAPLVGMDPREGALTGLGLGLAGGRGAASEVTPEAVAAARPAALDLVARAGAGDGAGSGAGLAPDAAAAMEDAHPQATTAETLGPSGADLAKRAAYVAPESVEPLQSNIAARQQPEAVNGRLADDIHAATDIDPVTAKLDAKDATEAAQKQASPLWDAALQGNGVTSPELEAAAQHPLVQSALNQARSLIGPESDVPNPAYKPPEPLPNGPSAKIDPEVYQSWVKSGSNDPARLVEMQQSANAAAAPQVPKTVPTDRTWDMARRLLNYGVDRDSFGKVDSSSPRNVAMQKQAANLTPLLKTAIPGLSEALDQSGDYLSNKAANDLGAKQFSGGKDSLGSAEFGKRFDKLSPGEQQSTRQGYLGQLYSKIEKGGFNPDTILKSDLHRQAMAKMFGPPKAQAILQALEREKGFAAGANALGKVKGKPQGESMSLGAGALFGAMGHAHPIVGAIKGAAEAGGIKGAKAIADALKGRNISKPVAHALADILAQPAEATREELLAHHQARQSVRLSNSTLRQGGISRGLTRGVGTAAASGLVGALNGLQ
jgi:hypothetical protein